MLHLRKEQSFSEGARDFSAGSCTGCGSGALEITFSGDPRKSWLWVAAVVGVSFSGKLSIKKACLWCPDGFCAGKKKPEQTIGKSAGFTPGLMTRGVCKRIAWPLAGSIAFPKHASLQIISRGIS